MTRGGAGCHTNDGQTNTARPVGWIHPHPHFNLTSNLTRAPDRCGSRWTLTTCSIWTTAPTLSIPTLSPTQTTTSIKASSSPHHRPSLRSRSPLASSSMDHPHNPPMRLFLCLCLPILTMAAAAPMLSPDRVKCINALCAINLTTVQAPYASINESTRSLKIMSVHAASAASLSRAI